VTTTARAYTVAHGLICLWMTYCGGVSADHHATGIAAVFTLGAAASGCAVVRELLHADEAHAAAVRAEAAARPVLHPDAADALELAIHDLNTACCDGWVATLGDDHDPQCPTHQNRRHAA
jgi:hypothetical protein